MNRVGYIDILYIFFPNISLLILQFILRFASDFTFYPHPFKYIICFLNRCYLIVYAICLSEFCSSFVLRSNQWNEICQSTCHACGARLSVGRSLTGWLTELTKCEILKMREWPQIHSYARIQYTVNKYILILQTDTLALRYVRTYMHAVFIYFLIRSHTYII